MRIVGLLRLQRLHERGQAVSRVVPVVGRRPLVARVSRRRPAVGRRRTRDNMLVVLLLLGRPSRSVVDDDREGLWGRDEARWRSSSVPRSRHAPTSQLGSLTLEVLELPRLVDRRSLAARSTRRRTPVLLALLPPLPLPHHLLPVHDGRQRTPASGRFDAELSDPGDGGRDQVHLVDRVGPTATGRRVVYVRGLVRVVDGRWEREDRTRRLSGSVRNLSETGRGRARSERVLRLLTVLLTVCMLLLLLLSESLGVMDLLLLLLLDQVLLLLLVVIDRGVVGGSERMTVDRRGRLSRLVLGDLRLMLVELLVVGRRVRVRSGRTGRGRGRDETAVGSTRVHSSGWGSNGLLRCWGRRRERRLSEETNDTDRQCRNLPDRTREGEQGEDRRLTLNGPVNFSPVMNGCRRACEGDHRLIGSMLSRPKQKSVNEDRIAISAKPKREEFQFSKRQLAR